MKKMITAICLMVGFVVTGYSQSLVSQVWNPDLGDGTYKNPVINADYSDPDVCVVGEDYYLTASSFQCIPGLPILHSKDLVNWEILGYALEKLEPEAEFCKPSHGNGVWAPSIRYHQGLFYIYWGDPDHGIMMVKSQHPAGPWTKPFCVIAGKGMIDPCPLWDESGHCYLVNGWANSRSRFASVLTVREMNAEGTQPIGQPVIVFDGNGTENRTCEGPKFYQRDGWYWIFCPAGGVPTGFQLAMRSKSPYGPYESKVVLAQGKTAVNGPHQGAWVHTVFGEDWFIHFQDKEAYGRVCHLQPVDWSSGWPVMGKNGEPVVTYRKPKTSVPVVPMNPVESDEFNCPVMGKQWQWHANYDQKFGMPTSWGVFRVYCYKAGSPDNLTPVKGGEQVDNRIWNVPNLFLQKTPADHFTATAKIRMTAKEEEQMGGVIMMGLHYSALVIKRVGNEFQLQRITCKDADKGNPEHVDIIAVLKPTAKDHLDYQPAIHEDIFLRMVVSAGKVSFFYSTNGKKYKPAGAEFTMKEGKWIGAKIGLVAVQPADNKNRGWIDADWFRITP